MSGGGARKLRKIYESRISGRLKAEAVVTARNRELRALKKKYTQLKLYMDICRKEGLVP